MFQFNWSSHRALLAIAIPMIVSNITVPLLGLVDTAVIGHLQQPYYLGGVAIGAMIITFMLWISGFLRMATTGVTAQAYGQGSQELQYKRLAQGISTALLLGLLIMLLREPIKWFGFGLAGGSEEVQYYGKLYFDIRIYSLPAALINMVLLGWMLGMQSGKGPMWHLIVINSINIGLDILFVPVLGFGVAGAAWATVIADYSGVIFGWYYIHLICQRQGLHRVRQAWYFWQHWVDLKPFLLINRDIFLRTLMLGICFVFITFTGAKLGDDIVAANAILNNLLMLVSFALDGIAYAVEALVGMAVGRRDIQGLLLSIRQSTYWALLFSLQFTLLFWLAGEQIIRLMSDIDSVIDTAMMYLPWIIFMPLISVWCYLFDGVFIGLVRAKDMRNAMFISTLLGFFTVWWFTKQWGNHSLWLALSCLMLLRGVTLWLRLVYLIKNDAILPAISSADSDHPETASQSIAPS